MNGFPLGIVAILWAFAPVLAHAETPAADDLGFEARAPFMQVAQLGDPEFDDEETLDDLMAIEYEKDAWSVGQAVTLSFIPGGGFGLIYAKAQAQSVIPFLLSGVGYTMGAMWLSGVFDEQSTRSCQHVRAGTVPIAECGFGDIVYDPSDENQTVTNQLADPRSRDGMTPYYQTKADYSIVETGRNYEGAGTGVAVLGATYALTTLLGAVWAALEVKKHNEQLRKDINSTARLRMQQPQQRVTPLYVYDGETSMMGVRVHF